MTRISLAFVLAACLMGAAVHAQTVDVKDAWARTTVPGQKASGAFMKLTAREGTRLVGASSPVAGVTEVHEMKMEGDVMKMRAIAGLDLPAGQTVELKPGGYHVMLLDLKTALRKDSSIPLTLVFKDAKGVESKLEVSVPVLSMAPGGAHGGHGMKH
ncbi:MAG: copper chaperone PCu(A)C [Hylemonella sp.]|uniref:copper chaperone PCu(A)C n=1 Tax=Hylemonella sp. TaxID=2066020 RepID=UPI00391AF2EB